MFFLQNFFQFCHVIFCAHKFRPLHSRIVFVCIKVRSSLFSKTNWNARLTLAAFLNCLNTWSSSFMRKELFDDGMAKRNVLCPFFSNSESTMRWLQNLQSSLVLSQLDLLEEYPYQSWISLVQFLADSTNVFVALKWQNLLQTSFTLVSVVCSHASMFFRFSR